MTRGSALAAAQLPLELTRRVRVGVDRKLAPHFDSQREQASRWVRDMFGRVAHRYEVVGGSPLIDITRSQAYALQQRLDQLLSRFRRRFERAMGSAICHSVPTFPAAGLLFASSRST